MWVGKAPAPARGSGTESNDVAIEYMERSELCVSLLVASSELEDGLRDIDGSAILEAVKSGGETGRAEGLAEFPLQAELKDEVGDDDAESTPVR